MLLTELEMDGEETGGEGTDASGTEGGEAEVEGRGPERSTKMAGDVV